MTQLKKKFILDAAVDGTKIKLLNNQYLSALASDGSSVDLFKLTATDTLDFPIIPKTVVVPTQDDDLCNKLYVDQRVVGYITQIAGSPNGLAQLDSDGLIPTSQLPALSITDVFVVSDLSARDALVIGGAANEVQLGDVAIVISDSSHLGNKKSYIYDGNGWQILNDGDAVDAVNGYTGYVILTTTDVSEGSNLYFTDARAKSATVVNTMSGNQSDQAPSVASVKSYLANSFVKEKFVLTPTDVANGYITLSQTAKAESISVYVDRLALHAGDDYLVSVVGGFTRLTWTGSIAAGGLEELQTGDVMHVNYSYIA